VTLDFDRLADILVKYGYERGNEGPTRSSDPAPPNNLKPPYTKQHRDILYKTTGFSPNPISGAIQPTLTGNEQKKILVRRE
jgi:hypothetical protein